MEVPGSTMEEIYALPPRLKYTESWLRIKGKKFIEYWIVLKGTYMFFFKDQNTHVKEQYAGYIGIQVQQTNCFPKKGSKTDFIIEMGKKKFHLKADDEILRDRWVHAVNLVNRAEPPGPLPGDEDFMNIIDPTPTPSKMKKRAHTVCVVGLPTPAIPITMPSNVDDKQCRDDLSLSLDMKSCALSKEAIDEEEEEKDVYDPVFVFPSWYYQNMSRQEAEQIMSDQSPGSYLLRDSNKANSLYALTIKDIAAMKHHRIWVDVTNGKCHFESSPDVKLPNLLKAIDSLMKNTYHYLIARPVCMQNRSSGDGEETVHAAESSRKIIKSATENSYMSPNIPSPQSPSSPFSPFSHSVSLEEKQTSVSAYPNQKANSLPAYQSRQRQPRKPAYENHIIIENHSKSNDAVQPLCNNNNNISHNQTVDEEPPPLPVKKKSLQRTGVFDHTYENVPFVYKMNDYPNYDSPAPHQRERWWSSTSST